MILDVFRWNFDIIFKETISILFAISIFVQMLKNDKYAMKIVFTLIKDVKDIPDVYFWYFINIFIEMIIHLNTKQSELKICYHDVQHPLTFLLNYVIDIKQSLILPWSRNKCYQFKYWSKCKGETWYQCQWDRKCFRSNKTFTILSWRCHYPAVLTLNLVWTKTF